MSIDRNQIKSLVDGYHARVPRYTSYPTAVEFKKEFTKQDWNAALIEDLEKNKSDTSLYVHIPYCPVMCFFCACSKEVTKDRGVVRPYLDALKKELSWYAPYAQDMNIVQLHWGGGSPNFLSAIEMDELYQMIRETFPHWSSNAEISVELDPRETTFEQIDILNKNGCKRFSFGVQDFDEEVQRLIHRKQSLQQTTELITYCRNKGGTAINTDLIYGLPGQTRQRWSTTIGHLLELSPDRLALYGYAHVEWRSIAQKTFEKKSTLPTAHERVDLFVDTYELLSRAGYYYIGMDHFSKANDALAVAHKNRTMRRNFMGYTTGGNSRVIGLGPSAISSVERAYAQNVISVEEYHREVNAEGIAVHRGVALTKEDLIRKHLIESIMCTAYLDIEAFEAKYNVSFFSHFNAQQEQLESLVRDGIITIEQDGIQVTLLGRVFLRSVASVFDQYLSQHQSKGDKVFSMAV